MRDRPIRYAGPRCHRSRSRPSADDSIPRFAAPGGSMRIDCAAVRWPSRPACQRRSAPAARVSRARRGRRSRGESLDGAEDAVGPSGHLGHLDERRRDRHSDGAAGSVRGPRRADRGRVRRQAEARRGDAQAVGRPLRRVLRRQRLAEEIVQPDVADCRWRRQDAAADAAGRDPQGLARPRHVRRRAVRKPARISPTTIAASPGASSARCSRSSTATATESCRRRTKW